jgi:ribosomal subunit interface protein
MEIHIEGQHIAIPAALHDWITERLDALNTPQDDIVHARVALEKNQHHQQGADEAHIVLAMTGKTLSVTKTGKTFDEAVNQAFDAITREVRDFRQQRRRVVKEPGLRLRGRIVRIFHDRGYGFAETDAHREVYFHVTSVHGIAFEELDVDMLVDMDIETGDRGPQAAWVTPHR